VGDLTDFPEQKQVGKYPGHVSVVVPNVLSLLGGAEPVKEYKGGPEAIFLTLGKVRGFSFCLLSNGGADHGCAFLEPWCRISCCTLGTDVRQPGCLVCEEQRAVYRHDKEESGLHGVKYNCACILVHMASGEEAQ